MHFYVPVYVGTCLKVSLKSKATHQISWKDLVDLKPLMVKVRNTIEKLDDIKNKIKRLSDARKRKVNIFIYCGSDCNYSSKVNEKNI